MKRWVLLNMAPVVRVERGWPWSHRWVRILPLICSVQMPPKRRASAGVAQAKRGRASSIAASGSALPDPTPPVSEAVIDNIADRVLARIEERLALRFMPPNAEPPPPTAVLPNLAAQAPLGPAVQNAVVSAPMTGQLPSATGPVPNVQTGTAPHMSLGQVPDQYHSPEKVTAQVLEAAAARLTGSAHSRKGQRTGRPPVTSTSQRLPGKSPFGIETARSSSPTSSLASLTTTLAALVDSALAPASQACYRRGWNLYVQFAQKYSISDQFPVRVSNLALFIAYLVNQSYKPSTISFYVSAIGYVHKLKAIPDPTSSFLILKLLRACHKQQKIFDSRMPIVKPVLERLMLTLVHTGTDHYHQHLFQTMFALAFYAFLRIGEITIRGKDRHDAHLIQKNQIRMQTKHFELKFISYKHSQGQPFSLSVMEAQGQGPCPVRAMQAYLQVRGDRPGPLFQYATGHAVLRNDFNKELRRALLFCDLDPTTFKGHSFRIGAATTVAQLGMSDSQIRTLGRWKSDAFKQYIRCAALTSTL